MGMTPNMGEGGDQRAAGGPPMPGMGPNGPPNGGNGGGSEGSRNKQESPYRYENW